MEEVKEELNVEEESRKKRMKRRKKRVRSMRKKGKVKKVGHLVINIQLPLKMRLRKMMKQVPSSMVLMTENTIKASR